jgi:hypothetical protein
MWEPTRMLANQHGLQQRQCPLGQASLAAAYKDANLRHTNQSVGAALTSGQLLWSAPSNSKSSSSKNVSRLRYQSSRPIQKSTTSAYCPVAGSQSPSCQRKEDQLAHSHPAATARMTSWLTVTQLPTQGRPAGSQSPSCQREEDQPVRSHPAANARKTSWLTVTQLPTQGRPAGSQSSSCQRKEDQLAHSHLAADARKIDKQACCGWSSTSIHGVHPALSCNSCRIEAKKLGII